MKIGVVCAGGKSGSLIAKEAAKRGHSVLEVVRNSKRLKEVNGEVLEKDLFQLTYEDLKECDVIINAFGAWTEETFPLHKKSLMHLSDILSGKKNRLLVVGGAGSLYVDREHKTRLMDTPDFPEVFKPLASAMGEALDELRKRNDVNWTYLSPAANFVADGKLTGKYISGGEELIVNKEGNSEISYADYAVAMIDEAEAGKHIKERFTVVA